MSKMIFAFLSLVLFTSPSFAQTQSDPLQYIDTRFPDGGEGKVFRGANVPFGMMMWGPAFSGYSLSFLSGAEMDLGFQMNLPILPTTGRTLALTGLTRLWNGFILKPKSQDSGTPGYFHSVLSDGTDAEFTVTLRTGIAHFTYPSNEPHGSVLFYLDAGQNYAEAYSPQEVRGYITRNNVRMYFAAFFDQPFTTQGTWKNIFTRHGVRDGDNINGFYTRFDTSKNSRVTMKIATSYVSVANAELNLQTENPGWDFEGVKLAAEDSWRKRLSAIEIEGGTDSQKRMFYTHLYQSFFHPNVFSDVNGDYIGFDNQVHHAQGYTHYANFSGWDIYRTWIQLVAVLFPKDTSDMMQSLVNDAAQGGGGLPIWPVANRETGTMAGGSTTPLIANAYAFGARGFDLESAYQAMDRDESDPSAACQGFPERAYLAEYEKIGYVSWDHKTYPGRVSASLVLDMNQGEFALSQFASALGHADRSQYFLKMSENWKNVFNSDSGFIQPREYDGSWYRDFDPNFASLNNGTKKGFDEGNAQTWTWQVPHNLGALIGKMGGNATVIARLDDHFTKLNDGSTLLPFPWVGKYSWIGNEPEFNTPWVYNWAGAPWKTQNLVRRELLEEFSWRYPGDEDLGAMSAWAVWGTLGLYPSIPGVGGFTVGSPLFPLVRVHLGNGHTLDIHAESASAENPYIQSMTLNGVPESRTWVNWSDLSIADSKLEFSLGVAPNLDWGSHPEDAPPSFDQ